MRVMKFMNSMFAPTVSIGRLAWDAAQSVLQGCSPQRQTVALPYLLAMYSFMAWWENEAACGDEERELSLTTTWCEQPEVLELINVADLNLEGLQLSLYPLEVGEQRFKMHCPTFLGVLHADLAVAVELDRDQRWAKLLGFVDRATLVQLWQAQPPDAQGFSDIPLEQLQSIYYLPERISCLQPATPNIPPKSRRKTNRNQPLEDTVTSTNVNQLTETLLQLGVTPVPGRAVPAPRSILPADLPVDAQNGETVGRLVQALQVYRGESAAPKITRQ